MDALTEIGQIGVRDENGDDFLFSPSLRNISKIGRPSDIVKTFHLLHGRKALPFAMHVMRCCAECDADSLIGWEDGNKDSTTFCRRIDGSIPDDELIILAKSLMTDGITGRARPQAKGDGGKYSDSFDASEFVDAAMVHLGLTSADAWQLTMTQFQRQIEMKFPDKEGATMTEDKYKDAKAMLMARREKAGV